VSVKIGRDKKVKGNPKSKGELRKKVTEEWKII